MAHSNPNPNPHPHLSPFTLTLTLTLTLSLTLTLIPDPNPNQGALVAHSARQLVESAACDAIVEEAEAHAAARGGWSAARHNSYPTTDVPLQVALAPDEPLPCLI